MTETVPAIDLAQRDGDLAKVIAGACSDWGFFHLLNHGLPASSIQTALDLAQAFFALPAELKLSHSRGQDSPWGFYDRELTKNLRDRKEIFDFSLVENMQWPQQPAQLRTVLEAYALQCHALAMQLLGLACRGLGFAYQRLAPQFQPRHSSFTRLNYYPPPARVADEAGPLGISRHTDAGALTLLLQDAVSGLQVQRGGQWHDIEPLTGAITVNVGDMLQVWSNDRYHAALHRVLASTQEPRFTIAYFLNPAYDCTVTPLVDAGETARYSPILWREFRDLRALGDYDDYGDEVQISHYRHGG